jgi:hypothetical protein
VVFGILPGVGDLAWCAVGQPGVRSVVVVLDVGADDGAGVVEGLELFAPDAALFELAEPPAMNRGAVSAREVMRTGSGAVGSTGCGQAVSLVGVRAR